MLRVRCCGLVVLVVVLVAASVLPVGAATGGGGSSGSAGSGVGVVAVGGFSDVGEGSVHGPAVGALAADGVFEGTECGLGLFCPGEPILRWEMAVWLVRVLDDGAEPEEVGSSRFSDVDAGVWWAPYVERFAELGVTRGCATGPLRYCPQEAVTRAQMASFLVRAFGLDVGPPAGFTDVRGGETHAANIDALAASGVTQGCTDTMFCPRRDTTRAQMATFVHRARNLGDTPGRIPTFDPFTTPTVSDIDLDRLADAVATLDPDADCPPTASPASLDDVAEVVRITDGCLNIEYIPLQGRTVAQVRQELASDPDVHAVGRAVTDYALDSSHEFPYDEDAKKQWHLEAIEADKLWDGWEDDKGRRWPGSEGAGVVVAVIDTGVDGGHRDLDKNIESSVDACHRTDINSHGTHVAGIVAAERNSKDVAGVAPEAKIVPIRLLAGACVGSATAAVDLAIEKGADVINMSFRRGRPGAPYQSELDNGQDTFEAVLRAAMMRDVVPVTSAGNCGDNTEWTYQGKEKHGWEHNDCSEHNEYAYPKVYSGVIVVANTKNSDGDRAASSTYHEHVGIAAPGSGILSTFPSYTAGSGGPCTSGTTCYVGFKSGTSMAAPVISGVVAHMKARFPKASVGEIRQALYTTAKNPDSGRTGHFTWEYGWGVVQPLTL